MTAFNGKYYLRGPAGVVHSLDTDDLQGWLKKQICGVTLYGEFDGVHGSMVTFPADRVGQPTRFAFRKD